MVFATQVPDFRGGDAGVFLPPTGSSRRAAGLRVHSHGPSELHRHVMAKRSEELFPADYDHLHLRPLTGWWMMVNLWLIYG
jgi:hypothetical protein